MVFIALMQAFFLYPVELETLEIISGNDCDDKNVMVPRS